MSGDPFAPPASGDFLDWDALNGQLLLYTVRDYKTQSTKFDKDGEPSKCIEADVVVLTGDDAGTMYEEALIFPRRLVGRLKPRIGEMVLARTVEIISEELRGKYGKNSKMWDFADPPYSDEDANLARKWIAENIPPEPDPFAGEDH